MSEKAYGLSHIQDTYVFVVPMSSNKSIIANAVSDQFNVTVTSVKVIINKGKKKMSYQKRNRPIEGKRADTKKAYVRLKQGDKIPIFAALEEDSAKEAKAEKKATNKDKEEKK